MLASVGDDLHRISKSGDVSTIPIATCALFVDVDGTLLDFAATPEAVAVPDGLHTTLALLQQRLDGALAIVSGRSLESLDRLFWPLMLPAAAEHGLELRDAAGIVMRFAHGSLPPEIREAFSNFVARNPGALMEEKGLGLALHVRNLPSAEPAAQALGASLAARHGQVVRAIAGKRVVEIQLCGGDKGRAIERFMRQPPFAGRVPLFAGDDETDEAGFAAVNRLGGISIRVGESGITEACYEMDSPEKFRRWLAAAAEALSASGVGQEVE